MPEAQEASSLPTAPSQAPLATAPAQRWSLWRPALWSVVAAGISVLTALSLLLGLALHTASGTRIVARGLDDLGKLWQLVGWQTAPLLRLRGTQGALLGPTFSADSLEVVWHQGQRKVRIEQLRWEGAQWRWLEWSGLWFSVRLDHAQAERCVVDTGPATPGLAQPPGHLHIPLWLSARRAELGRLEIDRIPAFENIRAQVTLSDDQGRWHRFQQVEGHWDRLALSGDFHISADPALDVRSSVEVSPRRNGTPAEVAKKRAASTTDWPWQGRVVAQGTLQKMALKADLWWQDAARRQRTDVGPWALQGEMTLQPFAAWPLGELDARWQGLDLASLSSAWPRTSLSGQAKVQTHAHQDTSPAPWNTRAELTLANALPQTWDRGGLPLRQGRLELLLDSHHLSSGRLEKLDLSLTDGPKGKPARLRGELAWSPSQWRWDLQTEDLRLQTLDTRAPALTLSGPAQGQWQPGQTNGDWLLQSQVQWQGQLQWTPRQTLPVQVSGQLRATPKEIQLGDVMLGSGGALLKGQAMVQGWQAWATTPSARPGQGVTPPVRLQTQGELQRWDPSPWLPSVWQHWSAGGTQLSGDWKLDLQLPHHDPQQPWAAWVQTWQGLGQFRLQPSQWLGQPVRSRLELSQDLMSGSTTSAVSGKSQLKGEVVLGETTLQVLGRWNPRDEGGADRWELALNSAQLGALQALRALGTQQASWAEALSWLPQAGSGQGQLALQGRWPQVRSQGQVQVRQLRTGPEAQSMSLKQGQARWAVDLDDQSASTWSVQAEGFQAPGLQITRLQGEGQGTLADHRGQLQLEAPYAPPSSWVQSLGLPQGKATHVLLGLNGRWLPRESDGERRWQGRVDQLDVRAVEPGSATLNTQGSPWLRVQGAALDLHLDPQGQLRQLSAAAGQATLIGGLQLRWEEARWQQRAGDPRPDFSLQARLEAFDAIPWLRRLEPQTEWSGDLRLQGLVQIQADKRLQALVSLGRQQGDVRFKDGEVTRSLGIREAQLRLQVEDGRWTFTPLFAGDTLGVLTGAVQIQGSPQERWPAAQDRVEGALHANVTNLSVWRAWLAPGWQVGGELWSTGLLSGPLSSPEIKGELQLNELSVRNALQGVDFRQGHIHAVLEGAQARIRDIRLMAGDGQIVGQGDMQLGRQPQARLDLKAQQFRVLGRVDRQLVTSGQLRLAWKPGALGLDGQVLVDRALIDLTAKDAPALDRDVVLQSRQTPAPRAAPEPPRPVDALPANTRLNVKLDMGPNWRVRGRGLDTLLRGQLQLNTDETRLGVQGTVRTEQGSYAAYGQKLNVERGLIQFSGRLDNPLLDILALRTNTDVKVGVAIGGTAQSPRVRLYSDPDMNETEKLSWLVLGRGSEGLGRNDSSVLQRAAVALLAGEGQAPTETLLKSLGIDDLSVRQTDGDVRETVVSLGRQLSRNWYLGYERGVNATSGTFSLIYRLGQTFTVRAQGGAESALDLIWTWRFNGGALEDPMAKSMNSPP